MWWFLRHHKMGVVGGCFFGTGCVAYMFAVWQRRFLAHAT